MNKLELKARLLCEGANAMDDETKESLSTQNPQKVLRGGWSTGLKVKLDNEGGKNINVNFPLYSKVNSPIKIKSCGEKLIFIEGDEEIGSAEIIKPPKWYDQEVQGYPITSILTQHGDQLVGSFYEWCSLFNTGEQCKFCVINKSQKYTDLQKVTQKSRLILEALSNIPKDAYRGIGLNGGMTFGEGRGIELAIPLVRDIRSKVGDKTPIAVEITPPKDLDEIQRYADAGGTSLMMNLETWDDTIRERLIPGKTKYCQKEDYFKAFEKALKVLGEGKVSTCFVVGTEPKESLRAGIEKVIDYSVVPSPLAGRYFEQFMDYDFDPRADWKEFLEIFMFTRRKMLEKGLISRDKAGCVACGMCDIIGDT